MTGYASNYRYGSEIGYPQGESVPVGPVNYAASANGGVATSNDYDEGGNFTPDRTINGFRHTNNNWGGADGSGWSSTTAATVGSPKDLEVTFSQTRTITEINVFTLADSLNYNTDPTLSDTFTSFGIVDFTVDYWDGAWQNIATVTGNNKVWRQFATSVSTSKVRVRVTSALGGGGEARIVELEAWG